MNNFIPKNYGILTSKIRPFSFLRLNLGDFKFSKKYNFEKVLCVYFLIFLASFNVNGQTLAFPEAEGFGRFTTGGRGGDVIKVTNLNNSGSGSLRAAIEASGARTIVFEVGGTITLTEPLYINNGDLTIAGQTAPGDGILIKDYGLNVRASNIIIRYIRIRPSTAAGSDCVTVGQNGSVVEDVIFDHCSFSWASDENFSIIGYNGGKTQNVTLQNSINSEATYGSLLSSDGTGLNAQNITIYRNLYANNDQRNVRYGYPIDGTFGFEEINNIIYGWGYSAIQVSYGTKFTALNNKFKTNGNTYGDACVKVTTAGETTASETYAYIDGNESNGLTITSSSLNSYLNSSPYLSSGINPIPASELEDSLLDDVGCSFPNRDAVDARIVSEYNSGTGSLTESGTYPTIAGGTAPTDTDDDGMPDTWETANGLDINDPSDRNIYQNDGYTNLEHYINGMVLGTSGFSVNAGQDVSICEGESVTLTANGADSYVWSGGETSSTITVSPTITTSYTVTGTDSQGNVATDVVVVTVNPIPEANAGGDVDICEDNSVSLSASGGDSYQWSTGETTQTIVVSPEQTTTYTVTVTQNGCSSTDDVLVTVKPRPVINAGNDVDIYLGESTTLTAVGEGTYEWSTGETTESIVVSPTETTNYTVTTTFNGCSNSDNVTVTVLSQDTVEANAGEDITICQNESATLTASGGTSYLWSTGETSNSIVVSPDTTTTYSVTVSNENSSDIDEVIVNVNPLPIANAGEDVNLFHGQSATLTANGGTEYIWNTGETTQSITVNPTENTTYTVEVIDNGCSDFDSVEVFVGVQAEAGDDVSICEGDGVTLSASGGPNYLWSTGETTQSITVYPTQTSTYSVTVSNNSSSDTDNVTVVVNLLPNAFAGDDVTIEAGQNVTLSASGGNSYLWNTGETTQNISVSPENTTTYLVEAIINGCSNYDEVTVNVVEPVNADAGSDIQSCPGEEVVLTATGGLYYEWNTGETTPTITVNPDQTTIYSVNVSNGISEQSDSVRVSIDTCSSMDIDDNEYVDFDYRVYPNPTNGELNVKLSGLDNVSSIYISNLMGKTILTDSFDADNGSVINKFYNLTSFSKGIYFVTFVQSGREAITKKLIVQ